LGDGTTTGRNRPVQVTNLSGVVAIAAGMVHGLALKSDGTVWAWGNNSPYSQLGNGTNVDSRTPVQVSNLNAGSGGPAGTPFEEWLILHFGSLDNPDARPDADPDSDGAPNRLEFPAGTNPTNRASVLRLQQPQRQGNDILLTWTTAGGRTNVVQWAAGVADDSFSDLGAPLIIAGQGDATTNRVDPGAATNALRFYRIRLGP
ncbi:MAG: hypothetical protein HZA90_02195, partial [Verrucomicrobia bacterium]|nr:hypothetical protein [Verrucomicrobiota bacterium]